MFLGIKLLAHLYNKRTCFIVGSQPSQIKHLVHVTCMPRTAYYIHKLFVSSKLIACVILDVRHLRLHKAYDRTIVLVLETGLHFIHLLQSDTWVEYYCQNINITCPNLFYCRHFDCPVALNVVCFIVCRRFKYTVLSNYQNVYIEYKLIHFL